MRLLPNTHVSPETAYVVPDYPFGFRLRCQMRYWIEYQPKKGFRLWSQTSNPKRPGTWNKPKSGTYSKFGMAMYLDDNDHVQHAGLSEYSNYAEAKAFVDQYLDGVPEAGQPVVKAWLAAKEAYEADQTAPTVARVARAREAFVKTMLAEGAA